VYSSELGRFIPGIVLAAELRKANILSTLQIIPKYEHSNGLGRRRKEKKIELKLSGCKEN
jgi:hypothetical protein